MLINETIAQIKLSLVDSFSDIDKWFDKDSELRQYRPKNGGWTIDEILEHIGLTNHYLLVLIDKATNKAVQNIHKLDLQAELEKESFNWEKLKDIGIHKSFAWIRPAHMEPTGAKSSLEVREQLQLQLQQCIFNLDRMRNGEGVLFKTTMTVNGLGKINVYEYLYFLSQHGQRHVTQMEMNELEFKRLLR